MIQILDSVTANGISAGEVVERPASVVKELIENSLDAGATIIHCKIEQGGIKRISVTDNGTGMSESDAKLAFERHATSKLNNLNDLDNLITMGFRGEALASIAAVSKLTMRTRQIGSEEGFEIVIEAGEVIRSGRVGCPEGTQIEVCDLFYNVPARYKFLKRDTTEQGYISDLIMRLALSRADVSFRLTSKNKDIIHTPGNNNLLSAIYVLLGREIAEAMLEVNYESEPIQVSGYVASSKIARGNRSRQILFVNGRNIQSKVITAAINEASKTWFMKGKFPILVINISVPLHLVDVNVHPQKIEVRFWDEQKIFHSVYHALRKAWEENSHIYQGEIVSKKNDTFEPISTKKLGTGQTYPKQNKNKEQKEQLEFRQIYTPDLKINEKESEQRKSSKSEAVSLSDSGSNIQTNFTERIDQQDQAKVFINQEEFISDSRQKSNHTNIESELAFLSNARLIGQVFQTYLLLEYEDKFVIIDQHAAHERILYEELYETYLKNKNLSVNRQSLLSPLTLKLTPTEIALVQENKEEILHLGFEVDEFGDDTIIIRSVPDTSAGKINIQSSFEAILDSLIDGSFFREDKRDELLYTVACKAAVKAHDKLSYQEMKQLIEDLIPLKNPFHCPHGRPLIITLTRQDFDKLFKRII
ncbi:MAG: DNA mismatch repair endonuclease MutL [Clostridiaceae bacterium]|nr:DNA mismatch repair endonuclease MutL [Clostridiaceae bacterium]